MSCTLMECCFRQSMTRGLKFCSRTIHCVHKAKFLGRVLPGQRDGSLLWHRDITTLMRSELGMTPHTPCPCILKSEDNSCFVLIHVDDILTFGRRDFVMNKLVKCLSSKNEVSTQVMEKPGDELQFLKRRMVLQHDYRLAI
jgi:hypothetical protein